MAQNRQGRAFRHVQTLFKLGVVGGLTDGQLLERFVTRDGEVAELAFAALVERHGAMVLRVCRSVLRDEHEVQDAFQATFLVLVRKAGLLWVRRSLGPWLHQVALRVASRARSAAARRRRHERQAAERSVPTVDDGRREDLGPELHEEVSRLPERYLAVIVLCYLEGLTHEQAAQRLGCPVGTVQSRLARGRERLRDRLMRRGVTAPAGLLGAATSLTTAQATVPAALVESTIQAAMQVAAGQAMAAGAVSASVLALTEGVMKAMFLSKVKIVAVILLAAGVIATGTVAVSQQGSGEIDQGGAEPPAPSDMVQDRKASDPTAETRLRLAREGFKVVSAEYAAGRVGFERVPVWSRRIMEAERDLGSNDVKPLQDHLARMKDFMEIVEARYKTGNATQLSVFDARFTILEAEALLEKARSD